MEIKVHFTANKVGKYELACRAVRQLHFKMKSYMLVLPEADIQALQAMPQEQFQARVAELLNTHNCQTTGLVSTFQCAPPESPWCLGNTETTETQRTQRLHRENDEER